MTIKVQQRVILRLQPRQAEMVDGYSIRRIRKSDYEGVVETLKVLTVVGNLSRSEFEKIVEYWDSITVSETTKLYNPLVVVDDTTGAIAATGNVLIERKLIHEGALCGHIEDIAVSRDHQGRQLGRYLIEQLTALAVRAGCYKVILDCDPSNVAFYEKCQFTRAGVEMQFRTT